MKDRSRQRRERQLSQAEILLWRSPEGIPKASRDTECNALLSLTRAVCVIAAQRQPGKFEKPAEAWLANAACVLGLLVVQQK
jgi:hypothetical protein